MENPRNLKTTLNATGDPYREPQKAELSSAGCRGSAGGIGCRNRLAKRMQTLQIEEQAHCAALGEAGIGCTAARLNNAVRLLHVCLT